MKPTLIVGLGNPLMGADGIGCRVAEALSTDPRLPADTEVLRGGTDLLRLAVEGRHRVILIDAALEGSGGPIPRTAHALSVLEAMNLLQLESPNVAFTLITVPVDAVEFGDELPPALVAKLPEIVDTVIGACRAAPSSSSRLSRDSESPTSSPSSATT